MPSQPKPRGNSAEARGLTIHGTPPGGPGNRPTGFSRIAASGESFTGQPERWLVTWAPCDVEGGPPQWVEVRASTWFDARAEARRSLRALGVREGVPFELGRIVP